MANDFLLAGNEAIKNDGMEGWQRMTVSDVDIPQKISLLACGNRKSLA